MKTKVDEILNKIDSIKKESLHLYFIVRVPKPRIKKSAKVLDKYDFEIYQVDIDKKISEHLHKFSKSQLERVVLKNYEMTPYEAISDDSGYIYSYDITNKSMSFLDIVTNRLNNKSKIPKIKKIADLINSGDLWAYSVGFYSEEDDDWVYSFRKVLKGKVSIDAEEQKKNKALGMFRTKFNTTSSKLEILEGETVNLDERIDCVYFENVFYIFHKTQFEQITGLTEEFKEHAQNIASELIKTQMFDGMELLNKQIQENPAIHKKLVRLKKLNNYQNLNESSLDKMITIAEKYGGKLVKKDGKILIESEPDLDLTIKVLVDFYKTGEFSGKPYGTFSGKQLVAKK